MKKILLITIVCLFSQCVFAQVVANKNKMQQEKNATKTKINKDNNNYMLDSIYIYPQVIFEGDEWGLIGNISENSSIIICDINDTCVNGQDLKNGIYKIYIDDVFIGNLTIISSDIKK
jgi:hypothetical protein